MMDIVVRILFHIVISRAGGVWICVHILPLGIIKWWRMQSPSYMAAALIGAGNMGRRDAPDHVL
jgi:hypothetical protein